MEKINETYQVKIQDIFPELDAKNKQEAIDSFGSIFDNIFEDFANSPYVQYIDSKPENISKIEHYAKIPDGIDKFEVWLKTYLEQMSSQFTRELQKQLPPNISLIYFAQLLDSQNYGEFFKKVKLEKKMQPSFKDSLQGIFNEKGIKHFILAMSCSCIGLANSATSLNNLWIQSCLFEDEDINKILNEARKLEAISNNASLKGKKGAENRWNKKKKIKEYAIELSNQKTYISSSQAARAILKQVLMFAKEIGEPFTDDFQAYDRICKWLRTNKKSQ